MTDGSDSFSHADLSRVVVVGTTCSGKTTFARRLARAHGIPHIELDALYWLPDWVERPKEEFRALAADAAAQDKWVMDGNYSVARDLVWPRATCIIWLNYRFATVVWRGLNRTVRRSMSGEELFSGNRETFAKSFLSRDSILRWLVTSYGRRKREYRRMFDEDVYPDAAKVEFRSPGEASVLLPSP